MSEVNFKRLGELAVLERTARKRRKSVSITLGELAVLKGLPGVFFREEVLRVSFK